MDIIKDIIEKININDENYIEHCNTLKKSVLMLEKEKYIELFRLLDKFQYNQNTKKIVYELSEQVYGLMKER